MHARASDCLQPLWVFAVGFCKNGHWLQAALITRPLLVGSDLRLKAVRLAAICRPFVRLDRGKVSERGRKRDSGEEASERDGDQVKENMNKFPNHWPGWRIGLRATRRH